MKRTLDQNSKLHALLTQMQLNGHKKDLILAFTEGRSESSKDLTVLEAKQLIQHLENQNNEKCLQTRKNIAHYLALEGFVTDENKPDYDRINKFIVNIGSNNPKKKELLFLNPSELNKVCTQVIEMYKTNQRRHIKEIPK